MYIHIIICVYIYIYDHHIYLDPLDRGNFHTKAKIDQFCQIQEKKSSWTVISTPERFFFTPERLRTVLNVFFFTLLERVFPLKEPPTCLERQKPPLRCSYVFFFHIKPQNPSFIGGVKKNQYWEVPGVYIYIFYNTILYIYILYTYNDTHGYEFLRFIWWN